MANPTVKSIMAEVAEANRDLTIREAHDLAKSALEGGVLPILESGLPLPEEVSTVRALAINLLIQASEYLGEDGLEEETK